MLAQSGRNRVETIRQRPADDSIDTRSEADYAARWAAWGTPDGSKVLSETPIMNHPYRNDYRIQNRPPPPLSPVEDEGVPPVDPADVGRALWKLAQVGMGALAGTLTGLFFGGLLGAVMGMILANSALAVIVCGFWGSVFGLVIGGLVCGILVWNDRS
jgi:hypothetical protein